MADSSPKKTKLLRRFFKLFLGFGVLLIVLTFKIFYIVSYISHGEEEQKPEIAIAKTKNGKNLATNLQIERDFKNDVIRVMSLNLAHGRGNSYVHRFLSKDGAEKNLRAIAEVVKREKVDVLAMQEADSQTVYSGSFSHVNFLAGETNLPFNCASKSVEWNFVCKIVYGVGILSNKKINNARAITFKRNPPTFSKGLISAELQLGKKNNEKKILIASVHLGFSRDSIRQRQAREVVSFLKKTNLPIILMGDFNCEYFFFKKGAKSPLQVICEEVGLQAFEPAKNMPTFPLQKTRLDWILISKQLEFINYKTLADKISDHRAVMAEIKFIKNLPD